MRAVEALMANSRKVSAIAVNEQTSAGVAPRFRWRQHQRPNLDGEAVSSRVAGTPAQEEIDETSGKFLRPRSDIAHFELLA
jgi:hypothetical protein